jgi:ribosomal protein S12
VFTKQKNGALKSFGRANTILVKMYETKANERQTQSKESQLRTCPYTRGISTVLLTEPKLMVPFMKANV